LVKKARDPRVDEDRDPKTYISTENHMEVFRRLAAVKNMHGKPGPRPGRKDGK